MYDLVVIGGGINGAGIASDAAGRRLRVLLCEKGDLASETSSYSSKLIHGGLRYLEQLEVRLVRESLNERNHLLSIAPHLVHPLHFMIPHNHFQRPKWVIYLGLKLYDFLRKKSSQLPSSKYFSLSKEQTQKYALKKQFFQGFSYYDCITDDARLTILNALSARDKKAEILTRTMCESIQEKEDETWDITLKCVDSGVLTHVQSKAIINATGPWVNDLLNRAQNVCQEYLRPLTKLKHVKGSHIIVPKIYDQNSAFLLQNADNRIVFIIPYEEEFSLIGTTEVIIDNLDQRNVVLEDEIAYLLKVVHYFFDINLQKNNIISQYAGSRPLLDDEEKNPSKVSREYRLHKANTKAPFISIYGGKLTTYRKLAQKAVNMLSPHFTNMNTSGTKNACLPGGHIDHYKYFEGFWESLQSQYPTIETLYLKKLAMRYGSECHKILQNKELLSLKFGPVLSGAEVLYVMENEWAKNIDDILWRRTKAGLFLTKKDRKNLEDFLVGPLLQSYRKQ